MTICAVIDSNNQLVNTIVAEPTDPAPEGCKLLEIPEGMIWNGTTFVLPTPVLD